MTNTPGSAALFQLQYMGQTIDAELTELNSIGYPAGVSTGDPADAGATNPAALNLPGTPDVEGAYNILPAAPY